MCSPREPSQIWHMMFWVTGDPTALLLQMCEVEHTRGEKGKAAFNTGQVGILQALYLHLKLLKSSSEQRKLQGVGHVMSLILCNLAKIEILKLIKQEVVLSVILHIT